MKTPSYALHLLWVGETQIFPRIRVGGNTNLQAIPVLSAKSITGDYAGIDRRPCINSEGGHSAPEAIEFKMKTGWV